MNKRRPPHLLFGFILLFLAPLAWADNKDLPFRDIHGNEIRMSDFHGKWVVVNYWASWCPPCVEELPELVHFHETHKDDRAVVLGVNMEELSLAQLSEVAEEFMLSFPVIPMTEEMPVFGSVPGLPTTFLIDPQGNAVARQVGQVTAQMIEDFMARAD